VRLDYLKNFDGSRIERTIATGDILRDETFADTEHWVANGRFGEVYEVTDTVSLRGALISAFACPPSMTWTCLKKVDSSFEIINCYLGG
jgi:hypothetical protein